MLVSSYDPDKKPKKQREVTVHFAHEPGLSFELVLPEPGVSTFSQQKPQAFLFVTGLQERASFSTHSSSQEVPLTRKPYWRGPVRAARAIKKAIQTYKGVLSQEALDKLITSITKDTAATYLKTLFAGRDYSEVETKEKLLASGYDQSVTADIIERAIIGNLINDERFAEVFIRSKMLEGWGPMKIKRALAKKGIALDEVKGWPDAFIDPAQEVERAFLLIKNRSALRNSPFEKAIRFLASRGFSYDVSKQAAQKLQDYLSQES